MRGIRKGDLVEVLSGNDRGKRGRVLRVIPKRNRVVVEGVNLRWKHLRRSQQNPQGGRVRKETPVHVSNVMLYDEEVGARTRVGFRVGEDGKKIRVARKTGRRVGVPAEGGEKKATAKKKKKKRKKKAAAKKEAEE